VGAGRIVDGVATTVEWESDLSIRMLAIQCCNSKLNEPESAFMKLFDELVSRVDKELEYFKKYRLIAHEDPPSYVDKLDEAIKILESKLSEQKDRDEDKNRDSLLADFIDDFRGRETLDQLAEKAKGLKSRLNELRAVWGLDN